MALIVDENVVDEQTGHRRRRRNEIEPAESGIFGQENIADGDERQSAVQRGIGTKPRDLEANDDLSWEMRNR